MFRLFTAVEINSFGRMLKFLKYFFFLRLIVKFATL